MAWWCTKEPKKSEVAMENDTDLYREVAVSSREEQRPCFLVSRVLLQVVNNLLQIGNIL